MGDKRIASLDVLRVLSMFFVVVSHYIYFGIKPRPELQEYYSLQTLMGGVNFITLEALYIISCVAVNCFVMISGYFMIEKTSYRWKGILNVWIETLFYSILFLVAALILKGSVPMADIPYHIFPIWSQHYWFVTFYIGLMLLAPMIARATVALNEKQYRILLLILFVMNFQYLYGSVYGGFASLMWFSFLFLVGGYFKRFGCPEWITRHKGVLLLGIWGALTLMALGMNLIKGGNATLVSTSYHGPVFFLSVSVFVYFAFTDLNGKWVDLACKIAPYTFAVYLIHFNGFLRDRIWDVVVPSSPRLPIIVYCLVACFLIFVVCVLIDIIRSKIFEATKLNHQIDRLASRLQRFG